MPQTAKRGGGSFLPDANGHAGAVGGGKPHDGDLLSNTDILYLKNVILKFIQVIELGLGQSRALSQGPGGADTRVCPDAIACAA